MAVRYVIETEQRFTVKYGVEAHSEQEAWDLLLDGVGDCETQVPGPIVGERAAAVITRMA